jgi:hypothetical protein
MPPVPRPRFPNAGTDRRPDELERNLKGEARAVETDRVADEDRLAADERSSTIESRATGSRRLVNVLALSVLALLVAVILLGTMLALSL